MIYQHVLKSKTLFQEIINIYVPVIWTTGAFVMTGLGVVVVVPVSQVNPWMNSCDKSALGILEYHPHCRSPFLNFYLRLFSLRDVLRNNQ